MTSRENQQLLLYSLDGMLVQRKLVAPQHSAKLSQQFTSHLYTWVERATARFVDLGQEQNLNPECSIQSPLHRPGGGGGSTLLGICCWMGPHFHDSTDYNGVAFLSIFSRVSVELLEWGNTFSGL